MRNHLYWPMISFILILSIAGLACSVSVDPGGQPDANAVETQVAATLQSITVSGEAENPPQQPPAEPEQPEQVEPQPESGEVADGVLPAPVYYLSGDPDRAQVYRLERDGVTTVQVTAEASGIEDFDVSKVDGAVVYLINNQLYRVNADGSGRTLLVDGGQVDQNADNYYLDMKLDSPRWSPDGTRFAYYLGGLNFYNVSDGSTVMALPNKFEVLDNGYRMPQGLYFPGEWSLDGQYLMLNVGWFEGGTIGIYNATNGTYTEAKNYGIFCCFYNWASDSRSVLVASDVIGMISSGMWRMDAASGEVQTLLDTQAADGSFNFAAEPHQMPNGDLRYFYHNSPDLVEGDTQLQLVHSAADGFTGRQVLVAEQMVIYEALWSQDGSLVLVVVQSSPGDQSYPQRGTLKLVNPGSGQMQELLQQVRNLRWGP